GINTTEENILTARQADVLILAVKPYHIEAVLKEIKPVLSTGKLLISIVAGVSLSELGAMAGTDIPIFRVMPNTAIALQESLTCISANGNTAAYREYVTDLFNK